MKLLKENEEKNQFNQIVGLLCESLDIKLDILDPLVADFEKPDCL